MIHNINLKSISKIMAMSVVMLIMILSVWTTVYAIPDYTVLAPLPGTVNNDNTTNLGKYLPGLFNFSIGLAAFAAFVMITYGGILYMTTDAISGKSQGREYIENALWGLLLVIGAWVILYTINPKILNFNLDTPKPPLQERADSVVGGGGTVMTAAEVAANEAEVARLHALNSNISVANGPCINGPADRCTNVVGLQPSFEIKLQTLANSCFCSVVITGGTEGGHTDGSVHPSGLAADLRVLAGLNDWLGFPTPVSGDKVTKPGIGTFKYEIKGDNGVATGAHWHLQ